MAFTTKAVTLLLISTLFLSSIEATEELTTLISYISSSPESSPPAAAPSPSTTDEDAYSFDQFVRDMPLTNVFQESAVSVPVSTDQKQVAQVVEKSMQKVEQKIDEFNAALKKRLEDPDSSATTQECISQCEEVYQAAVDDIKNSIDALNNGNFAKANFDISAVSTNVDTCEECFNEMIGEDPELKKFDDWVRGITSQALGSLEKVSS